MSNVECAKRFNEKCYGEYHKFMCSDCSWNKIADSPAKKTDNYISTKDKLESLMDYLTGKRLPDGVSCKMPKMSRQLAFTVIWFLQEEMHCLPDHIEQCQCCLDLFDSNREGCHLSEDYWLCEDGKKKKTLPKKYWGNWCDNCVPGIGFELK